jgi:hypothetical protein
MQKVDGMSFLIGIVLVNQFAILFSVLELRKEIKELNGGIQRLCAFLSGKE